MVVHDFDIGRARLSPAKAHPERIVHANAVLPQPVTRKCFESVSGWQAQVLQLSRDLELP